MNFYMKFVAHPLRISNYRGCHHDQPGQHAPSGVAGMSIDLFCYKNAFQPPGERGLVMGWEAYDINSNARLSV
jgi:hypothetical protein